MEVQYVQLANVLLPIELDKSDTTARLRRSSVMPCLRP